MLSSSTGRGGLPTKDTLSETKLPIMVDHAFKKICMTGTRRTLKHSPATFRPSSTLPCMNQFLVIRRTSP